MAARQQVDDVVLVGFDLSDESRAAVRWAAREAAARDTVLLIVHSIEDAIPLQPREQERVRELTADGLADVVRECEGADPRLKVRSQLIDGPPEMTLPEVVDDVSPAVIVLGASGLGAVGRVLLGSTAAEIAHKVQIPLVVVRGEEHSAEAPIVAGLDGSDAGDRATEFALGFAERHGARVRVVHALGNMPLLPGLAEALESEDAPADTDDLIRMRVDRLREGFPEVPVDCEVVPGRPAGELIDRAQDARLVVVGSRGRGLVDRILLGSVSHALLYHAPCPVALIRP